MKNLVWLQTIFTLKFFFYFFNLLSCLPRYYEALNPTFAVQMFYPRHQVCAVWRRFSDTERFSSLAATYKIFSLQHRTHHQSSLTRISTFFSNFHLPVKMADSDADPPDLGEDNDGWEAIQSELVSVSESGPPHCAGRAPAQL